MFGFGLSEFFIIIVVLFMIMKPEDLPKLFREIGRLYGTFQRTYYAFIDEINSLNKTL